MPVRTAGTKRPRLTEQEKRARLIAGEVMEVMHDGAAQVAEHEPEDCLENFFGCRRHAGRISQVGMASRIIVNDALFRFGHLSEFGGLSRLPETMRQQVGEANERLPVC